MILLVAAIARVLPIAADEGYVPENDAFDYHRHAASLAAGEGYPPALLGPSQGGETAFRPPAYPFVLAGVYAITGGDDARSVTVPPTEADLPSFETRWTVARVLNAAFGVVGVLLIYLIAHRLWGSEAGIVAAAIAAIFPPLVFLSVELMSESLFIALELGAVLAVLVYRDRPQLRWAVLAGALCGLAALTRSNGILLIVVAAAGVWILRPRWSARALTAPALLALVAALVIVPWTVRNYTSVGRFVPVSTQAGFSLAGTYNPTSLSESDPSASWRVPTYEPPYERLLGVPTIDEATLHSIMRREATSFALDHPSYVAEATATNLLRTFGIGGGGVASADGRVDERGVGVPFSATESPALWAALMLAGIGALALLGRLPSVFRPRGWSRGPLFVWLLPVAMIAVAVPIIGLPRYRAVADPFIVMFAAIGAIAVVETLRFRRGGSVNDRFGVETTSTARTHSGRLDSAHPS